MRRSPFGLLDAGLVDLPQRDVLPTTELVSSSGAGPAGKAQRPKSAAATVRGKPLDNSKSLEALPVTHTSAPTQRPLSAAASYRSSSAALAGSLGRTVEPTAAAPSSVPPTPLPRPQSATRPKSAGLPRAVKQRQLLRETLEEEVSRAIIRSSVSSTAKIGFPFLRKGTNNTCVTYSCLYSDLFPGEEDDPREQQERRRENLDRVQRLADERKKRAKQSQAQFSQHLHRDMFEFFQCMLLTLQEANDICRELRKHTVFELLLLPMPDVDVTSIPTDLANLTDLALGADDAQHAAFLTQVFLRTDQAVQIQKRTRITNLRATSSNSSPPGSLLAGTTNKYIYCAQDAINMVWRQFLKEHELLQRQYRQYKALHPELADTAADGIELSSLLPVTADTSAVAPKPRRVSAQATQAVQPEDPTAEEPLGRRNDHSTLGGLIFSAVRNLMEHGDVADDMDSLPSLSQPVPAQSPVKKKSVLFPDGAPRDEARGKATALDVTSERPFTATMLASQHADEEDRLPTTVAKTPQEIQAILDNILSDLQSKKEVVEGQIRAIERKGWNQFSRLL